MGYQYGDFSSPGLVSFVSSADDLPPAIDGVISIPDKSHLLILGSVDLNGYRLLLEGTASLSGTSSETSYLTSTGLPENIPLITASASLPIRTLTIQNIHTLFNYDGAGDERAIDWDAFNIINVSNVGTIANAQNFIWLNSALFNSYKMVFDGSIDTVGLTGCAIVADSAGSMLQFASTLTINRRVKIVSSAAVMGDASTVALDFVSGVSIPNSGCILTDCSFSGLGVGTQGISEDDIRARFTANTGIENSAYVGSMYMQDNLVATVIAETNTAVKVAGTTTEGIFNRSFVHASNRLTYQGDPTLFFNVTAVLSLTSGNNNKIGIYVGKNDTAITSSELYINTDAGGRFENVTVTTPVQLATNDYIEVFVENDTSTSNITVDGLQVSAVPLQ